MIRNLFAVLSLLATGFAAEARAVTYQLIDLGVPSGTTASYGYGINDSGVVAAGATSGSEGAYRWQSGVWTSLGTLGGTFSRSYDVNALGVVAGSASTSAGDEHAFRMS